MEIELNTHHKLIKVKGTATMKELIAFLNKILPDFEWQEWSITEYPQQNWVNPGQTIYNTPVSSPGNWPITTGSPITMISGSDTQI